MIPILCRTVPDDAIPDTLARFQETGKTVTALTGHQGLVSWAAFSDDGKRIATASDDGTAKIWNAESGALLLSLLGEVYRVRRAVFSPDSKKVLTASDDRTVRI